MAADVTRAIAYALAGEDLGAQPSLERPNAGELERRLGDLGLGRTQMVARRQQRLAAEEPWPWPIPERLRAGLSAAQLQALCTETIDALRLRTQQVSSGTARPTPADRRLMVDRPPHW